MKSFLFLLLFVILVSAEPDNSLVGTKAPTFSLMNLEGSREYLRVWSGDTLMKPYINNVKHAVILSFWSTTCLPCMKEIPLLHQFMENIGDKPVKLFLVNIDPGSTKSEVAAMVKSQGWTIPTLLDPYQVTAKRYNATAVPTLVIINPEGKIISYKKGFNGDEKAFLQSLSTDVDNAIDWDITGKNEEM